MIQEPQLTERQERIIEAIDGGARTLREIQLAADISTTSLVSYNLTRLAARGLVQLEDTARGLIVADWEGFAAGWDAAARLAGNPDA